MHRNTPPGQSANPNVFSDEYSLEPIDSEQTTLTPRSPSISSIASSHTLRTNQPPPGKPYDDSSNELQSAEDPFGDEARVSFDDPNRSSLPQKGVLDASHNNRDSIASINTNTPSITQRSQSTSSRFSMPPRALSPYTGATGPSHPYAMYPQVGVSRSPSVTTTSTVRPMDRPLGDTTAPQHPYAMYSQNVVLEEGLDTPIDSPLAGAIATPLTNPTVIPLGFPGHNQAYQRPPGRADDDVGDLIGPDGHTEQLPPYSRYPENAAPKIEGGFVEPIGEAEVPRDEIPNATGGLEQGVGVQQMSDVSSRTMLPEQQAANDNNNIINSNDNDNNNNNGDQGNNAGAETAPVSGVMAFEEKLKSKGKKRACCGLPVWTIVLVVTVMVVAASIGGAIGGVLGARKAADEEKSKPKGPNIVTVTATPKSDATPISTIPARLKSIPTGSYIIPADLRNQSKFCISDPDYRMAWSCQSQGGIPIEVDGNSSRHTVTFPSQPFDPSSMSYGAQAPLLNDQTQSLSYVMDTSDYSMGPALFFYALFDKLVVLPQDTFSSSSVSSSSSSKRSISESDILASSLSRKQATQTGEKPWFCWWNATVLEFFLYVNETSRESHYSSTATLTYDTATETPSYGATTQSSDLPSYPRRIKIGEKRDYPEARAPYCQQMEVLGSGDVRTYSPATIQVHEVEPTPTTTLKGDGSATQTYTAKAEYESACYCASLTD
ncbi:uncharacterized protein ASPGLDRAFT_123392 [Aspergillus glaucus CBS 516.65]|uniref:DUF7820 domain-containing protein n=1 Tax=Aspergillus glaucus CBS 516.65 TaxID=1160497 RepID=A0A1L9VP71_ASPGL|nr:hypothetical protein ASPGLDRAFT_123392 [Aspergillus glaucus CBS 516.65]OJJ85681.1 hypothetical protein ASPGLDRAFT_123392 [Aspergillus glaucus CBS 516.65]